MSLDLSVFVFFFAIIFSVIFFDAPPELTIPLTVFLFVVAILLQFIREKSFKFPVKFSIVFLILFLSQLATLFKNGATFNSTIEILKLVDFYLVFIYLFNFNRIDQNNFFFVISSIGGFLAFWGITDYAGRIHSSFPKYLNEPFHLPLLSAIFFLLTGPLTFFLFLKNNQNNIKNIFLFIFSVFIFLAWYLSNQYLFLLFATYILVLVAFVIQKTNKTDYKEKIAQIFIFALTISVLLPNIGSVFGPNKINPTSANFQAKIIFSNKKEVLKFANESIRNNLLFGIGIENFENRYYSWQKNYWENSSFAGNEILQTLIENGLIGLSGKIIFLLYLLIASLKTILKNNSNLIPIVISLIIFIVLSFSNIFLSIFPVAITFFVLISVLIRDQDHNIIIKNNIVYFFLLPILIFPLLLVFDTINLRKSQKYLANNNFPDAGYLLSSLEKRPEFLLNPRIILTKAGLLLGQKNFDESARYLGKVKNLDPKSKDEIDYQIASVQSKNGLTFISDSIIKNKIEEERYIPLKYYLTYARWLSLKNENKEAVSFLNNFLPKIAPDKKLIENPYILEILEQTDDYYSLKQIYVLLFQLTNDKKYIQEFYRLNPVSNL